MRSSGVTEPDLEQARLVRAFSYRTAIWPIEHSRASWMSQALPDKSGLKPLNSLKKRAEFLALRTDTAFQLCAVRLSGRACGLGKRGRNGKRHAAPDRIHGNEKDRQFCRTLNRIKRRLKLALRGEWQCRIWQTASQGEAVRIVARRSAINEPDFSSLVGNFTKGIDRLLAKGNKAH